MPLLAVDGLAIHFGGIVAIDSLSLEVEAGQICSVIGPNGAGKTTLLNCLTGLYRPTAGAITFEGIDLRRQRAHTLAGLGIARTFQNLALFPDMTVGQNVMVGCHTSGRGGFVANALQLPSARGSEREIHRQTSEALERFGLEAYADRRVTDLPYGLQKRVEVARALVGRPRLLLLDEPAAGLIHEEVEALAGEVRALRDELGITVVLVEHHMGMVMQLSDQVVVLDLGRRIASGPPAQVANDPGVVAAYLGAPA